jgi:lambda repressor-like predicted transcriptional regulator
MHPELIKAHMRMKGVTPAILADRLGRSRPCITQVISAKSKTPEIQQAIAEVLGLPVSEIWPGQVRLRRQKN